jgi:hypothetical protein
MFQCVFDCYLVVYGAIAYFGWYYLKTFWRYVTSKNDTRKVKYVLITGCDTGFGYGAALDLSCSGCYIFAGCLSQEGVDRLQNDSKFKGKAFVMDVTKPEDIEKARKVVESEVQEDGKTKYVCLNSSFSLRR